MSLPFVESPSGSLSPRAMERVAAVDRFLVPVEERQIVRYLFRNLLITHNLRERLARTVVATLAPLGEGWVRLFPGARRASSVAAPGAVDDSGSGSACPPWEEILGTLSQVLAQEGEDLLSGLDMGSLQDLRWLGLRDYAEGGRGQILFFLFPPEASRPAAVLKLRPLDGSGPSLVREWEALRTLEDTLSPSLRVTLPRPLAFRLVGSREALLLSCLPGRSAYQEMQTSWFPRRQIRTHFRQAAEWLATFHQATRHLEEVWDVEQEESMVEAISRTLFSGGYPPDGRWYDDLWRRLQRSPLPLVAAHGDFWARNLILTPSGGQARVGVVDWERFTPRGSILSDLFHFPLTYGLNYPWRGYRRSPPEEAFRRTFLDPSPVSRGVREYLGVYGRRLGLEGRTLEGLFRLYLIHRASEKRKEQGRWLEFYGMVLEQSEGRRQPLFAFSGSSTP